MFDKVDVSYHLRNKITELVFLLLKAEDEIEYKEKEKHLLDRCVTDCPTICNYLTSRLLPLMKEKV